MNNKTYHKIPVFWHVALCCWASSS